MNSSTGIRKAEFKVSLSPEQIKQFESHSKALQWVWNCGLACIEWREWWEKWQQVQESPEHPDYAPEPVDIGWAHNVVKDKNGKAKKKPVYALCCDRVKFRLEKDDPTLAEGEWVDGTKKGSGDSVAGYWVAYPAKPDPVKEHWVEEPRLQMLAKNPYMSLVGMFAKKRWPEDHLVQQIPSAWVKGECKALGDAWASYKGGIRKRPRYKKRHRTSNLVCPQRLPLKPNGVNLPGLGLVKLKGLQKRWKGGDPCPVALIKEGTDFYVQISGEVPIPMPRSNGVVIGIDPGSVHVATDDQGKTIAPPRYAKRQERRKRKLQRKMARQYRLNTEVVYDENGRVLRHVPRPNWERKNHAKTKAALQRLEAKTARARRAYNHFHSTRLVQSADVIVLEDLQIKNVTAKVRTGKAGQQNGRKRKAGLNRSLLDNGIGQLYGMVEQKAKAAGKVTQRVNPFRTSMTCYVCGFSDKANRPSQSVFRCQQCGHSDNADRNAARNIKKMGILGVTKLTFDKDWAITVEGWRD